MGWARYYEDIEERYGDDTRDRYEQYLKSLEPDGHLPQQSFRPGEVWAVCNGRRFEDYMAFPVDKRIQFRVETEPGCEPPEVELRDGVAERELAPDATDSYSIFSRMPTTVILVLKCGGHRKEYFVHFLKAGSIDKIPEFAVLITALTKNPPTWSTQTFLHFREKLETVLTDQSVPKQFADGVVEYHLALFYENLRSPSFGKLLERANELLRCFTPYSDYAAMICGFYLFRTNAFDHGAVANIGRLPSLKRVFEFFTSPYDEAMRPETMKKRHNQGLQMDILVPRPDHTLIQALLCAKSGDLPKAASQVEETWGMLEPDFDAQRERRLTFLEARIHRAGRNMKAATVCYKRLEFSSQPRFFEEATAFLSKRT
jgi:hypothetical protein